MDWIASQYRMRVPGWKPKECFDSFYPSYSKQNKARASFSLKEKVVPGIGDVNDIQKEDCRGSFNYDHIDGYTTEYRYCSDFPKLEPTEQCIANCMPDCTKVVDFAKSCTKGTISGCVNKKTIWASQKYDKCDFSSSTWDKCRLQGSRGLLLQHLPVSE